MKLKIFISDVIFNPIIISGFLASIYLSFWAIVTLVLGKENTPSLDGDMSLMLLTIAYAIIVFVKFICFFIEDLEDISELSPVIVCIIAFILFVIQCSGFYSLMEGSILVILFFCYLSFSSYIFAKGMTQAMIYAVVLITISIFYLAATFYTFKEFLDMFILV